MNYLYYLLVYILLAGANNLNAREPENLKKEDSTLTSAVYSNQLTNGLNYYLKPIRGTSTISLNLWLRVGFNEEASDQQDISHAVEHLAFRSSVHFPEGLRDNKKLAGLGIKKNDAMAGTAYHFTHYTISIPSESQRALHNGLLWFKDILNGLLLTTEDINIERTTLRQEFLHRAGNDLSNRIVKSQIDAKRNSCKKSQEFFLEDNANFPPQVVRQFYKKWYRPDLAAVSVIGDIPNLELIKKEIHQLFSDLPKPSTPIRKINCDVLYYEQEPQFYKVERPSSQPEEELSQEVEIHLDYRDSLMYKEIQNLKGLKRRILFETISAILNKRFKEEQSIYCPKFNFWMKYKENPFFLTSQISVTPGYEQLALQRFFELVHQLKKYGVTEKEWKTEKNDIHKNKAKHTRYWVEEIIKYDVYGEVLPDDKIEKLNEWWQHLSRSEFNSYLEELIREMPEDIGIIARTNQKAFKLKEKEVRSWIKQFWTSEIAPYNPPKIPEHLMDGSHLDKNISNKKLVYSSTKMGTKELTLENGVKIIFLQDSSIAPVQNPNITLHGFVPYGAANFPKEDYHSVINAPFIIENSGVGSFDKFQVNRYLSQSEDAINLHSYINYGESGFTGYAKLHSFNNLLQMVYLYTTQPRKNKLAFEDWKEWKRKEYSNPPYGLGNIDMKNKIKTILKDSSFINMGTFQYQGLSTIDLKKTYTSYQKIFGNTEDFTFILYGNYSIEKLLPDIQKYLGNLPNNKEEILKKRKISAPSLLIGGPLYKKLNLGYPMQSDNYELYFLSPKPEVFTWKKKLQLEVLGKILDQMLFLDLRYKKGYGIYSPHANTDYNISLSRFMTYLRIECEPFESTAIQDDIDKIIKDIQTGKISSNHFENAKANVKNINSSSLYRQEQRLFEYYRYQIPWISKTDIDRVIAETTLKDIVALAKEVFKPKNQYEFLIPSKNSVVK
tara:strand:- start:1447 stop:4293 length:2847 start_codon:yes stop_codon:yes gene_type:complete